MAAGVCTNVVFGFVHAAAVTLSGMLLVFGLGNIGFAVDLSSSATWTPCPTKSAWAPPTPATCVRCRY
jgi:hypothetical protein